MKTLLLDLETSPNLAYVWGMFKQNVSLSQLVQPGHTLCFAAKWLGDKKVHFHRVEGRHGTPKFNKARAAMVEAAHELLEQADAIIHYNGTRFDIPTLNREFVLSGLTPPSTAKDIDLYRVVRGRFRFASNKLDFVSQALGLDAKVAHKGMELWTQVMAGDEKAWRTMKKYNIQDVVMMEPLYYKLQPWIDQHPNHALYCATSGLTCPNCGSDSVRRKGTRTTRTQVYPRYRCNNCGRWSSGRKNITTNKEDVLT